MKKALKIVLIVLEVFIVLYVILTTAFILGKNKYGYTQFGNYTFLNVKSIEQKSIIGSQVGDLIVINKKEKINKDDLIYFYSISDDKYIVKNSKVLDYDSDIYKIDNNLSVVSSRVLGKEVLKVGKIGKIFSVVENKLGFIILVLVPIFIIFIYQVCSLGLILHHNDIKKKKKKKNE